MIQTCLLTDAATSLFHNSLSARNVRRAREQEHYKAFFSLPQAVWTEEAEESV